MNQSKIQKVLSKHSVLESERLILRPFSISDAQDVFEYSSDEQVTRFLSWEPLRHPIQAEKLVKEFLTNRAGSYAIELKSVKKCIGGIELSVYPHTKKASVGYILNRKYWNNGYMTEALSLIMDFGFRKLKLRSIEANHYEGNNASGRVMKKCGMKFRGSETKVNLNGEHFDVLIYAVSREEWKSQFINSFYNFLLLGWRKLNTS